jgi:hypothetical protein
LTTFLGRIRRLVRRRVAEPGEQKAVSPPGANQEQHNTALGGGTTYGVQDGTMHVHNTGAKNEYHQRIEGGSAGAQGPGATTVVHNHNANPGPAGGSGS